MLNPNIWRSQQREFNWRGLRVCYQDLGEGPVLVLLHGLPGSSWDWHLLWPMLCGQFRLITLDFPGCGDSDKPASQDYRLADQADAVLTLLNLLGITEYQLVAHDYGAAVACQLADCSQPPERITMLAPRLSSDKKAFLWREHWLSGPSGHLLCRILTEGLYGRYLERLTGPYSRLTTQRLHDSWQLLTAHQGLMVLPRLLNYRYELPLQAELNSPLLPVPLQIIDGVHDPLARHRQRTGARLHRLRTGHFPHLEDPEHLSLLLLEFHCSAEHISHAIFENLHSQPPESEGR